MIAIEKNGYTHMTRYDLHCHSTLSDGSMTPVEIITHACSLGLQGVAITDHDTIAAFPEAYELAQEKNITLIPGIEMSSEYHQENIHVLGYAFEPTSSLLTQACIAHQQRREERNREIIAKLNQLGFRITYEEVMTSSPQAKTYGRPHIAKVLLEKGYIATLQEGFRKYMSSGRSCYVEGKKWTTQEAVSLIHAAHGFAILAHPHIISSYQRIKDLLASIPFDGIEAIYSRASAQENARYLQLARKNKLLVTGGSDFHGSIKPNIALGMACTPPETISIFLERFTHHIS